MSFENSSERNQVGTAPYTAPELIELGTKRNFPSDVYTIGMVMIKFTLLVSSSDLTFHHGRKGKRPTITPSKLSGLSEDVKHNWLITIKKSLHQDPDKPPHSHCYSSIREYDNQRGPSERFVQRYKERVYKGVSIKDSPLNVHQGTVVESAGELATALYEQEGITEDVKQELEASV